MGMLEEWRDSHNVSRIGAHVVWCTKYRKPILLDGIDITVKHTVAQVCADNGWACRSIEVMPEYIHLFLQYHPTDCLTDIVRTLKSTSAIAVFTAYPKLKGQKFWGSGLWSRGCFYASVGNASQETIAKYIENQKTRATVNRQD